MLFHIFHPFVHVQVKRQEEYYYNLASKDQDGIDRYYQFWFSSESNLNQFKKIPGNVQNSMEQFWNLLWGTWPWKASHLGPPAGPDPDNCGFRVYNGSLYFNIWNSYNSKFFDSADNNIYAAEQRWIGWFGKLHSGPFNWDCFSTSGWEYMDCVHDGQELAPKVIDVDNIDNDIQGCGVIPSGNNWAMIITISIASFILCCCICCAVYKYCNTRKVNKEIKKLSKFEKLDDNEEDINQTEGESEDDNKKKLKVTRGKDNADFD